MKPKFNVGDPVLIIGGPYRGIAGKIYAHYLTPMEGSIIVTSTYTYAVQIRTNPANSVGIEEYELKLLIPPSS